MRPRPETIRLGAREWPVRPLTLRQVQEIEPILMSSAAETKGNVAAAMAIVAIALGRDHADAAAVSATSRRQRPKSAPPWRRSCALGDLLKHLRKEIPSWGKLKRARSAQRIRPHRFQLHLRKTHDELWLHARGDR
jgi:hypothetical protein